FYVFPKIDGLFGRTWKEQRLETSTDVTNFLLEEAGVSVVPGEAFRDDRYIRISYATSMAELDKGLDRMAVALQRLA
ncbi:MAG: aspartate aminotransferase, partial [Candidatus Tectomicrobia bacterium]